MLVVADADIAAPPSANLACVEKYGDELRESYLDRLDKLMFRVKDANSEHRFFENGRVDFVKQVKDSHAERSRVVKYSLRPDGCTDFTDTVDHETHGHVLTANFDGRPDGIVCIAIALKAGQRLDVGNDCALSIVREKMAHVAVKLNPDVALGKFFEVYQDQSRRELRLVTREDEFGKRQVHTFQNQVPTSDPRYEMAKIMAIGAVKTIVDLERELFVNLFPFAEGETNESLIDKQRQRLYQLAGSLFTAFDEASLATS